MTSEGQAERDELQALVKAAMRDRTMTASELARAAGVTEDTMMRMTKALPTKNFTVRRVRDYLARAAEMEASPVERYSDVIETVRGTIGLMMSRMSPADQRATAVRVLAALFNGTQDMPADEG